MKIIISVISLILLVTSGFAKPLIEKEQSMKLKSKSDSLQVIALNNQFAFALYKQLSVDSVNLFFSPFSISSALAMAYVGSAGETKTQIKKVLFPDGDDSTFLNSFKNFRSETAGMTDNLEINNALWFKNRFKLKQAYSHNLQNYFASEQMGVDFNNPIQSSGQINNWISQKTKGKISNCIDPPAIGDLTRLIVTNTIYFNMEWMSKFDNDYTSNDVFYNYGKEKDSVLFMHQTNDYKYYENNLFQTLEMTYKNSKYSMVIFLPKKIQGLSEVESVMCSKKFSEIIDSLISYEVIVSIPKFKPD